MRNTWTAGILADQNEIPCRINERRRAEQQLCLCVCGWLCGWLYSERLCVNRDLARELKSLPRPSTSIHPSFSLEWEPGVCACVCLSADDPPARSSHPQVLWRAGGVHACSYPWPPQIPASGGGLSTRKTLTTKADESRVSAPPT